MTTPPDADEPDGGVPPDRGRVRQGRSFVRGAFYAISLAIIITAGFTVPLPFVETQPGEPTEIAPLVEIDGVEVTELNGSTSLLTIRNTEQPVIPAIGVWLDGDRELRPVREVFPPDIDRDDFLAGQRERFGRQFDVAAAVGARAAGVEVELETAVVVVNVVPDSPAEGVLTRGDIITEVDGEPLADAEALAAITQAAEEGQELAITIVHAGQEREVVATLRSFAGSDGPRLGVVIEDGVDLLRLPFDLSLREGTRIGGPSAGLMVAITVYDLLAEEDLLRGRTVHGTGTLGADGTVGPVGGIPQKLQAANEAGADLVLVPQLQLDDALAGSPEGLTVLGVATLDEALDLLRSGSA